MNWRGRTLTTHEDVIATIGAVTTRTGLKVQAALDTDTYAKGIRITDKDVKAFEVRHLRRVGQANRAAPGRPGLRPG